MYIYIYIHTIYIYICVCVYTPGNHFGKQASSMGGQGSTGLFEGSQVCPGAAWGPVGPWTAPFGPFWLTFWPRFYGSRNYQRYQVEEKDLGQCGTDMCT